MNPLARSCRTFWPTVWLRSRLRRCARAAPPPRGAPSCAPFRASLYRYQSRSTGGTQDRLHAHTRPATGRAARREGDGKSGREADEWARVWMSARAPHQPLQHLAAQHGRRVREIGPEERRHCSVDGDTRPCDEERCSLAAAAAAGGGSGRRATRWLQSALPFVQLTLSLTPRGVRSTGRLRLLGGGACFGAASWARSGERGATRRWRHRPTKKRSVRGRPPPPPVDTGAAAARAATSRRSVSCRCSS